MSDRLLLWEFDVVQRPSGRHISIVGQVNVDGSALLDVDTAEVKLIHRIVIFREEIGQDLYLWAHQNAIKEKFLLITVRKIGNELTSSFVSDGHGPFSGVTGWWSQELYVYFNNL